MPQTISQYTPHMRGFSSYIQGKYPLVIDFIEAYYSWMEENGNATQRSNILLDQRDIDKTLDEFLKYFQYEFLLDIPTTVLADKRKLAKHIKDFYRSRGSEKSYKFLFKILYNEDVDFYYPKIDIIIPDDGKWSIDTIIRTTRTHDVSLFPARQIKGLSSGAIASIENVVPYTIGATPVSEIFISSLTGIFTIGETVEVVLANSTVVHETTYGVLTGAVITNPGTGYQQDDIIIPSGSNVTGVMAVDVGGGIEFGRTVSAGFANFPQPATIKLKLGSSNISNYYRNMFVEIIDGPGEGQIKKVVSYNAANQVAVLDTNWSTLPTIQSHYKISLGQIKTMKIKDFGIGYAAAGSLNFTAVGNGDATGTFTFGGVGRYAGRYVNTDGFLDNNKFLQDDFYYQAFSYVLKVNNTTNTYRNIVKKLLHPASLALFGINTIESPTVPLRIHSGTTQISTSIFSGQLPTLDLEAQYSCLEDLTDSQRVFDVSVAYPTGYNAVMGSIPTVDGGDPTFTSVGLTFHNTVVNASYIPINMSAQTIVVVAKPATLRSSGLIGSIDITNDGNVSGFEMYIDATGALSFRVQKKTTSGVNDLRVSYPAASIDTTNYMFASLRYLNNTVIGNLNELPAVTASYPTDIDAQTLTVNSNGYYIGTPGYVGLINNESPLAGGFIPGGTFSGEPASITITPLMANFFDGTIAYVLVYNRYLQDSEIVDTLQFMRTTLLSRGITLL